MNTIMAKSFGYKHPMATANAAAGVVAILYVACRILVGVLPDFMFAVGQSWFHTIQFTQADTLNLSGGMFLLGLVSAAVTAWLIGYLFAILYNKFIEM